MKTRIVHFTYGTAKDAALKIPAEAYSVVDAGQLIRQSYLEWCFRPGSGLMSDEVVVSSIGKANYFAGALGGYEQRLAPDRFASLKSYAENEMGLAVDVVRFRNPKLSMKEAYLAASKNTALDESDRKALVIMSEMADQLPV